MIDGLICQQLTNANNCDWLIHGVAGPISFFIDGRIQTAPFHVTRVIDKNWRAAAAL